MQRFRSFLPWKKIFKRNKFEPQHLHVVKLLWT